MNATQSQVSAEHSLDSDSGVSMSIDSMETSLGPFQRHLLDLAASSNATVYQPCRLNPVFLPYRRPSRQQIYSARYALPGLRKLDSKKRPINL